MNKDFSSLPLKPELLQAAEELGYKKPTPIQQKAIPKILEGHDLLGCAQTGTGKTAAFLMPILHMLLEKPAVQEGRRPIQALILAPTRELAAQLGESWAQYARHTQKSQLVVFGGVEIQPQIDQLEKGIDILIATPGRLLDLHNRGHINFEHIAFFVLDEADRMLDMGFISDIQRLLQLLPQRKQSLLFSATMPKEVKALAKTLLHDYIYVEVDRESSTVENIDQRVMYVAQSNKKRLLISLLGKMDIEAAIIFTNTKNGADRVFKALVEADIQAALIHGNRSQQARDQAIEGLSNGEIQILVATDVAARGIDISRVSHVVNLDIPTNPEVYVHRIGRTGRAGKKGMAISFMDQVEVLAFRQIERLIGRAIQLDKRHEWHCRLAQKEMGIQRKQGFRAEGKSNAKKPRGNRRGSEKGGRKGGSKRRGGARRRR